MAINVPPIVEMEKYTLVIFRRIVIVELVDLEMIVRKTRITAWGRKTDYFQSLPLTSCQSDKRSEENNPEKAREREFFVCKCFIDRATDRALSKWNGTSA